MNTTRLLILIILAVTTTTAAAIELRTRRNRTRPCLKQGIPDGNYQHGDRSASVTAYSLTPLLLEEPGESFAEAVTRRTEKNIIRSSRAEFKGQETTSKKTEDSTVVIEQLPSPLAVFDEITDRKTKLIQWDQGKFVIDQCSVSAPALLLSPNGDWTLNLRADQNPKSQSNQFNPLLHIKRNKFVIRLRCYGNFQSLPALTGPMVGRPLLAELPVTEFWVENGNPKYVRMTGHSEAVNSNFDAIDRVELEFFYEK